MDINTTNIPNIGVREPEVIHRVERENAAKEFGDKNQQSKQEKKKEHSSADSLDDEVDVSEAYLASTHEGETQIVKDQHQDSSDDSEKRLDIEA